MPNIKGIQNQQGHHWIKHTLGLLICVSLCGVIAWAQKNDSENKRGQTLADLGVTEAQQTQLKALWDLKRQKQIQAVDDLKTLNRFAKDSLAENAEIQETLDKFRAKRKEIQEQIEEIEEELVQTLPTRAQLHLTLLGVLDNGIPRRTMKAQTGKKKDETLTPSSEQRTK